MAEPTVVTGFRIPVDLYEALRAEAQRQGTSMNRLITKLLERELQVQGKERNEDETKRTGP